MIIEERTKKVTRLLIRFLKQENLLMEYKKDLDIELKLRSLNFKCEEQIFSLEEFIQLRLNRCYGKSDYFLSILIDKTLVYNQCKYKHWRNIESSWRKFFLKNTTFLD